MICVVLGEAFKNCVIFREDINRIANGTKKIVLVLNPLIK